MIAAKSRIFYNVFLKDISATTEQWAKKPGIELAFIQPGEPQQNAYIERYNRTVRCDWLSITCLIRWTRFKTLPRAGSGHTITTAEHGPWRDHTEAEISPRRFAPTPGVHQK
jgi:transposase InsO family protein